MNAEWAYHYAYDIVGGRWVEGEGIISKDSEWAYHYAYDVIGGRWVEGEGAISGGRWAYYYFDGFLRDKLGELDEVTVGLFEVQIRDLVGGGL